MFLVVSYDIVQDSRRSAVSGILEGFGLRVQKSVFEVDLSHDQAHGLKQRTAREIDQAGDSVRFYRLCQACQKKTEVQGQGEVYERPPYYFV